MGEVTAADSSASPFLCLEPPKKLTSLDRRNTDLSPVVPKFTIVAVPFFCDGLTLLGAAILDYVRCCMILVESHENLDVSVIWL